MKKNKALHFVVEYLSTFTKSELFFQWNYGRKTTLVG